jgi:hypothetical protein
MAYKVWSGPHPNIVCLQIYGALTTEDMLVDKDYA